MTIEPQPQAEIKAATSWVITFSIGVIGLGILAILMPAIAAAFFTSIMGWIALISGVLLVAQSFQARVVKGQWLSLVVGLFYVLAGLYILSNLAKATAGLALAFGVLFMAEGIFTIVMAFVYRVGRSMSWLVALNGIITLTLGILVINRWPFGAVWLIALYVGISLLLTGASLLGAAQAVRKETPGV